MIKKILTFRMSNGQGLQERYTYRHNRVDFSEISVRHLHKGIKWKHIMPRKLYTVLLNEEVLYSL